MASEALRATNGRSLRLEIVSVLRILLKLGVHEALPKPHNQRIQLANRASLGTARLVAKRYTSLKRIPVHTKSW